MTAAALLLCSLLLTAPAAGTDAVRILRGAERLVPAHGRLVAEGCDGILRLHLPPRAFDRVKRLRLRPWGDALEGAEFLAGGTDPVQLKERRLVRTRFGAGRLDLAFPDAARPLLDRGGMLILVDRYR